MANHPHPQEHDSSLWKIVNAALAVGLGGFALVAGAALTYGGIKNHVSGPSFPAASTPPSGGDTASPAAPAGPGGTEAGAANAASAGGVANEVTILPDKVNPLAFGTTKFTVKAGQPVKLTFDNTAPVPQPHNFVLCKVGMKQKVVELSMAMAVDPKGMEKGFIPEAPEVLAHTKLLQPGQKETIEFTVSEPGEYPYICTFPGHSMIMFGTMIAE